MILNVTLSYDSFAKFFSWITTIMEELSSMCCPSVQFCLAALFFFFFFGSQGMLHQYFTHVTKNRCCLSVLTVSYVV